MHLLVLIFLLLLAIPLYRDHAVVNRNLDVLFLHGWQFSTDQILRVGLADVCRGGPLEVVTIRACRAKGHAAKYARKEAVEHAVDFPKRFPTYDAHLISPVVLQSAPVRLSS